VTFFEHPLEWILGTILVLSSIGVILSKKPVHSCLYFLLTLLTLATIYLQLSAQFIGVMQILVYAGAILVIFMYVMVLFQDANEKIMQIKPKSTTALLVGGGACFLLSLLLFGKDLLHLPSESRTLTKGFGTVEALGKALYVDFFFPFEALLLLFLIASIGALYIGKKEN
jgi:NADH-quinone oxidoreductase subunit J